ncbi:PAZ domain-containing protein [Tanacetum coccineum]
MLTLGAASASFVVFSLVAVFVTVVIMGVVLAIALIFLRVIPGVGSHGWRQLVDTEVSTDALMRCKERIELIANTLELEGFSRIDAFVNVDSGEVLVIEVNTVPGMTPSTVLIHQALAEEPPVYPHRFFRTLLDLGSERFMKSLQFSFLFSLHLAKSLIAPCSYQARLSLSPLHLLANAEEEEEDEVQIFYNVQSPFFHYRCRIPELLGKRIRGCFFGWVVLSNHPHNVMWSLWNPLTSKFIYLPPLIHKQQSDSDNKDGDDDDDDDDNIGSFCLSSPPDDAKSILLMTNFKKPNFLFCRLHPKRKKLRWTEMSYAKQVTRVTGGDDILDSLTCCNGKVYAFAQKSSHVVELSIVVKDTQVAINLLPVLKLPMPSLNECERLPFIVGTSTDLFSILIGFDMVTSAIGYVYLFKLNLNSKTWEEMEDLNGTSFSLEIDGNFYAPARSDSGGYIYILGEKRKIIHSYHVKDKTIALSSMPCLVRTSHVCAWTMPGCNRLLEGGDDIQEEDKNDKIVVSIVKSDEAEFNGTLDESHLLNLPFDVLMAIMEFSVGVEYMKFRASCKLCHLAAPIIQWSNHTASKRLQLVSPWLMVIGKDTITFIDPMFGDKYFIKTPRELELIDELKIHCSRYGWLLMRKCDDGPLILFNPLTGDTRKLPKDPYLESFGFSAPPTSPGCMVVGFSSTSEWQVCIHFVGQESSWREFTLKFCQDDPYYYRFPLFCGRDVYTLCNEKGLEVFKELVDEDYIHESVVKEAPTSCCTSTPHYFLVKCDHEYKCNQHLLLLIVGEHGETVEVFIPNKDAGKWEKIDDIGKHMIYVGDRTSLCMEAKTREMENKIYFPRLRSGKIVFFSLETCKFQTLNDNAPNMFSIRIHHGGKFQRYPGRMYVSGRVDIFDMVDIDLFTVVALNMMVLKLGYTGESELMFYNYLRPLTSLDEGLYVLACEEDVRCLATLVRSFKLIEVYIEHGVTVLDSYLRAPRFRATLEDITDEPGSIAANRTEKMLLLTWHESSETTKEPVCDSVTPSSLPQHDSSTPCKDSVCESITPRCMTDCILTPLTDESVITYTQLSGVQGVDTQSHVLPTIQSQFSDINLSFVSQQATASQVIDDVMRQLSFDETKLDGEVGFADVAGSGVDSSGLSHDESFGVDDLDINLNEPANLNVSQVETQSELHVSQEPDVCPTQEPILTEVSTQEPIVAEVSTEVPIVEEVGTQEFSVEDVVIEDYVSSGEDAREDVEQGNGQEDKSARTDGQFFYDDEGIDTAYETEYDVQSSKDAGTDDDDDLDEDFLVDEENEIVEPDVDVHLFGINMDLPFDNIGITNLVSDDVLEGEDVDVINADGFDNDPGNDEERNYRKRRLAELRTEMEGVINASGQWKYSFYTGHKFTTPKEAKNKVYLHSIESRRNLKLYKNDGVRIRARCEGKVLVFTMSQGTGPTGPNHGMEAEPSGSSGLATRSKKGRIQIFKQVRVNPDIPVKAVQDQLQRELEVQISMSKAFKAKAKAEREIRGDHGPFPGQVLVAVGLDSNNRIYPLAYALVEAETKSSWCWFLQCLGDDIDLHPNSNFTFISDRQKGIIPSIKIVLQDTYLGLLT